MSACLHALTKDNDDEEVADDDEDNEDDEDNKDDDEAATAEQDNEAADVLALAWQSCFLCQIIRV